MCRLNVAQEDHYLSRSPSICMTTPFINKHPLKSPHRKVLTEKSLAGKLGVSFHFDAVEDMGPAYSGYTVLGKDFPCPSSVVGHLRVELFDSLLLLTLAAAAPTRTFTASLSGSGSRLVGRRRLGLVLLGLSDTVSTCLGRRGKSELT